MTRSEALKSKKELQMMILKEDTMSRDLLAYKQDLERAKRDLDLAVKEKNLADLIGRRESPRHSRNRLTMRYAYEERVGCNPTRDDAEQIAHDNAIKIKQENDKLIQNFHSVQRELHARTDRYVSTLTAGCVQGCHGECFPRKE